MTKRLQVTQAPAPLETYATHFEPAFSKSNQREGFRQYLEGLLLPSERNKTLTGLVNTEPGVGAQLPRAQQLQWFLSQSTWDERKIQAERLKLLRDNPATAPNARGVLVIDETGDRKDGHQTAHVARQYLGSVGKIDNGVVSVSSLWADEQVYYPLEIEPYTPETYFAQGKDDQAFRTKPQIALQLVQQAIQQAWPFRAVVADSLYGEDRGLRTGLRQLQVPYVMALKPSHAWWHPQGVAGSLQEVAREAGWVSAEQPGQWVHITRTFRDGSTQDWWAVEIVAGPYGPDKQERAIVATTDPQTLPDLSTWYLVTNLPAPSANTESSSPFPPAGLEEVIRLYGLRMWVEQSYKQVKQALGWSQYQVNQRHEGGSGDFVATWFFVEPGKRHMLVGLRVEVRAPFTATFSLVFPMKRYFQQLESIAEDGLIWVEPGPPPDTPAGIRAMSVEELLAVVGDGISLDLEEPQRQQLQEQLTAWKQREGNV